MNSFSLMRKSLDNSKRKGQAFACGIDKDPQGAAGSVVLTDGRKRPQQEKSLISQLINGQTSFGEKLARRMEGTYHMPPGYLDWQDTVTEAEWAMLRMIRENGVSPKQVMIAVAALAQPQSHEQALRQRQVERAEEHSTRQEAGFF